MFVRALAGYEKASLPHTITALNTVRNPGLGIGDQAKKMFQRAVSGREKVLGPHHPHTLEVVNDLRELDVEVTKTEGAPDGSWSSRAYISLHPVAWEGNRRWRAELLVSLITIS